VPGCCARALTPERARTELVAISERLSAEHPQNTNVVADVATLHEVIVGDVRLALFVVFGAVLMVLLIACANVANLMLVRGSSRGTEMAVRAVLGAGRRRLIAQLVTESATLAVIGTVLGILLATWGVDMLRDIAPGDLPRAAEIGLDGRALGFAVAMAGITIFLFGLIPALRLSASPFAQTLREGGRGSTGGTNRARGIILATEVALSITLLLGAGLLLRSLSEMRSVGPDSIPTVSRTSASRCRVPAIRRRSSPSASWSPSQRSLPPSRASTAPASSLACLLVAPGSAAASPAPTSLGPSPARGPTRASAPSIPDISRPWTFL
jgi:hypothetical protein